MDHKNELDTEKVIQQTRDWVENFVIHHGLCPFARGPFEAGKIRFVVSEADSQEQLAEDVLLELHALSQASRDDIETGLLIHPNILSNFDDYNDFLDIVDTLLEHSGLAGTIQVASFHPDYCFADCDVDDAANSTNRSPWPMLHFIREISISEAIADWHDKGLDVASIPGRNIEVLRTGKDEKDA